MNRAQLEALRKVYKQYPSVHNEMSFLSFRRTVVPGFGGDHAMVKAAGMWIGIELDGYTHT